MGDYKSKKWRVMADYFCGLWDERGWCTGPDNEEINASDDYVKRFDAWVDRYTLEEYNLDLDSFNKDGLSLAIELKRIVGPDVVVTYVHEKPADSQSDGLDEEEIS